MHRGEIRALAENPTRFVLLLNDPERPYDEDQVRIAPITLDQYPDQTDQDLRLPAALDTPFQSDAYVHLWNARPVPTHMIGHPHGTIPEQAWGWVTELQRAAILGEAPDVPDELIGEPITHEDDSRADHQLEEARQWERLVADSERDEQDDPVPVAHQTTYCSGAIVLSGRAPRPLTWTRLLTGITGPFGRHRNVNLIYEGYSHYLRCQAELTASGYAILSARRSIEELPLWAEQNERFELPADPQVTLAGTSLEVA